MRQGDCRPIYHGNTTYCGGNRDGMFNPENLAVLKGTLKHSSSKVTRFSLHPCPRSPSQSEGSHSPPLDVSSVLIPRLAGGGGGNTNVCPGRHKPSRHCLKCPLTWRGVTEKWRGTPEKFSPALRAGLSCPPTFKFVPARLFGCMVCPVA